MNSTTPKQVYTTAISKGAGRIEETRKLLQVWSPGLDTAALTERVLREDLLGMDSAYTARDVVNRVFRPRFLTPTDRPARVLKQIVEKGLRRQTFAEMLFLYACRTDPMIYDFTVREYWPAVRRARTLLTVQEGVDFLTEARLDGRLENEWSASVMLRMSRCLLGILRDVGFLRGEGTKKEIVPYRVSEETVFILARELCDQGVTDGALCDHPDWGLFGLNGQKPLEIMERSNRSSAVIVQRAGSVVRLTWSVKSVEELINVLAG